MAKEDEKSTNAIEKPDTCGDGGRDENGKFLPGHKGYTVLHPVAVKAKELKEALLATITPVNIQNIIKKQITKAETGNLDAAKFVFDRCLGKPKETSEIDVNIRPIPPHADFDEVSEYVTKINRMSVLGGLDLKSIEGNGNHNN